jgi:ADP-heptose:LPS heptosyltransferase
LSFSKKIKGYLLKKFTKKDKSNIDFSEIKSVLFLRYDRIGDMIITTPVFRELKKIRPDIKIGVLASKANSQIIKYSPYVDDIYINDKHNNIIQDYNVLKKIKGDYDCVVEFDHSVVPHAIARIKILNPKIVISTYKDGRYGVRGDELELYDYYTSNNLDRHFRDIWLESISFFGAKDVDSRYEIFRPKDDKPQKFLSKFDKKYTIGVNLEGAVHGKEIKKDDLKIILTKLQQKINNIQIVILHTPNKHESIKQMIDEFGLDYIAPSYQTKSVLDVASLIEGLDLVITPDTSIVHIASCFDIPVVSIHENNMHSYRLFSPVSTLHRTIFAKSVSGLEGYSIDEVVEGTTELLSKIEK